MDITKLSPHPSPPLKVVSDNLAKKAASDCRTLKLAKLIGLWTARQRLGVRQPHAALAVTAPFSHHSHSSHNSASTFTRHNSTYEIRPQHSFLRRSRSTLPRSPRPPARPRRPSPPQSSAL